DELRRFGIQVKIIEPGGVKTDFVDRSAVWASHPDYTVMVERMKSFSKKLDASLPDPEGVARIIYRAAIDRSGRLRYSPHGEAYFWLHALLPDRVWRSLIENMMLGKSNIVDITH
ncbi:hypothetical protein VB693_28560, partial [Anabaena sp. UHCC 0399]|nr:hypothetical protein [Anabaena sp. UHCC 0399]